MSEDNFQDNDFGKRREAYKNHPLVKQGQEVLKVVQLLLESIDNNKMKDQHGSALIESAHIINAKLAGAIPSDSYLVCMQNAAIIRDHAEYIRLSNHLLKMTENVDKKYIAVLRSEMENFRAVFIKWANEIKHMRREDDVEDEWGLF